jgi:glutathione S-transferase
MGTCCGGATGAKENDKSKPIVLHRADRSNLVATDTDDLMISNMRTKPKSVVSMKPDG